MKKKKILLLFIMLSFCSMAISGFVLRLGFHHGHHAGGHHPDKFSWVVLHVLSSLLFVFLIVYHLLICWPWIHKNIITGQRDKQGKKLSELCSNDICCFVLLLAVAITGYSIVFIDKRGHLLKELHFLLGAAFAIFIMLHLRLHKYPSQKYFKRG